MRVYLAARWEQAPRMREWRKVLEANGIGCTSHWLDVAASGLRAVEGDEIMRENAVLDFEDIRRADVIMVYSPRSGFGSGRGGRHAELGVALGMGKPALVVGERENIFHWHPRVTVVNEEWTEMLKYLALMEVRA